MKFLSKIVNTLKWSGQSMAARIVLAYSALFFITFVFLLFTNLYGIKFIGLEGLEKHLHEEHAHKLENVTELNTTIIRQWIDERRGDLAVIANDPGVQRYAQEAREHHQTEFEGHEHSDHDELLHQGEEHQDIHIRLEQFIGHYHGLDSIYLVDAASGKMIIHSEPDHDGKFLAEPADIQGALTPGLTSSVITMRSPLTKRLSLVFWHQVFSLSEGADSNNPISLAAMFVSPDKVIKEQVSIGRLGKIGKGVELLLVDSKGRLLGVLNDSGAESLQPLQSDIASPLLNVVVSGEQGVYSALDRNQTEVLASFNKIPLTRNYHWYVIVKQPQDEITTLIRAQELQYIIIGSLGLVMVFGFSLLLGRYITKPLSKLGNVANEIATGNLSARVEIQHKDEIGHLGQAFNLMAERVQNSQSDLESLVQERTQQLTRQSRLYSALSQTNQMIVQVKDRRSLFNRACQIAVEYGDFAMVWIGIVEEDGYVGCVASFGDTDGYVCKCPVRLADEKRPEMQAILMDSMRQVNDLSLEPENYWIRSALSCGYRSAAALPLKKGNQVEGCIALYSTEAQVFDDKQKALLEEMAGDISFAMDNIESEKLKAKLEQQSELREKQFRAVLEGTSGVSGEAFFHSLVHHLAAALTVKYVFIGSIREDGKSVETIAVWADGQEVDNFDYQLKDTPCQQVVGANICVYPKGVSDLFPEDTLLKDMGVESYAGVALHSDKGKPIGLLVVLDDKVIDNENDVMSMVRIFSQRAQMEMQRSRAEKKLEMAARVFENAAEGIFITDSDTRIISGNPAIYEITGYTVDELVGQKPSKFRSGRHDKTFYQIMWEELNEYGKWQGEIWNRKKNGEIYLVWLNILAIKNNQGIVSHYLATFLDVTEKKKAQEHIEYIANHDSLTGLPNRTLLYDRLNQSIALAKRNHTRSGILFLDLDRFKNINDSLGHDIGDLLLKAVADRLLQTIRSSETVARLGGDDFVIVLADLEEPEQVAQVAYKILEKISEPYVLGSQELHITPSIGISIYPDDGLEASSLLKNADTALYAAKDAGRNNYQFYTTSMNVSAFEHLAMENSLRRAMEKKEFELYYQPQVNLDSGKIIGFEALIRWQHPELGMVSPAKFIPIAEESGLIGEIGDWVLLEACRQNKLWHDAGHKHLRIAVNISGRQFRHGNLLHKVEMALEKTALPSNKLELEITESILMDNKEENIALLHQLNQLGVELAIDDFGTGYSSLSYLKTFPIQRLKIDQSFVRELLDDADDASIVMAVIALAHSMNLSVIAEGAENLPQVEFLKDKQCDEVQGYYFSKPLPAQEIEKLLSKESLL